MKMLSIVTFYIFLVPLIICTILVPFVSRLSIRIGGIDTPDPRKVHERVTPRLGGIAIFASLLFTILFFCKIDQQMRGLLTGAIAIFLTGLADDLTCLTPRQKFAGQFLAAGLAVFMGGITVQHLGNPFGLGLLELGPLAAPFTIIAIVGLTNAINLLDGLDGLAGGTCAIACVSLAVISYTSGNKTLFPLAIALLGTLIGFLRHNNFPAKIFMGDSGSLLLGYCMGTFSIMLVSGGALPVSPYVPLLLLWVPILDTLAVMFNRMRKGRRLFSPDKTHLHHRLMDLGIGHKYTVLIVFGLTYFLNIIAILGCRLRSCDDGNLADTSLLMLLAATAAALYLILYNLISRKRCDNVDLSSNQSLRSTAAFRWLARMTDSLAKIIKALLISILLLPLLIFRVEFTTIVIVPLLLLIITAAACYLSKSSWRDALMQGYLYMFGSFMIFMLVNFGRNELLPGISLNIVSHLLFFLL